MAGTLSSKNSNRAPDYAVQCSSNLRQCKHLHVNDLRAWHERESWGLCQGLLVQESSEPEAGTFPWGQPADPLAILDEDLMEEKWQAI